MTIMDLYGQPVRRFPWLWSILKPQWRFMITGGPDRLIGTDWPVFQIALRVEYEHQLRSELCDPEWPCPYWDLREEWCCSET